MTSKTTLRESERERDSLGKNRQKRDADLDGIEDVDIPSSWKDEES